MSDQQWTQAEIDSMLKLWIDGLSAAECARHLNASYGTKRTRNAIIGKVNRMGAQRGEKRTGEQAAEARATRARRAREAQPIRPKVPAKVRVLSPPKALPAFPPILADVSFARPWRERASHGECKYPIGERGAIMSCCFPTDATYCPAHAAVMFRPKPVPARGYGANYNPMRSKRA